MARIRLATWHGGHAPGEVVEVPDDQVPGLRRDGRVAEVVADEPQAVADAPVDGPATEPVPPVDEPVEAPLPRRRGKSG
ncbi:hypothetical protein OHB04_02320 [Streptomyces sp. NBC_01775]|uniref:hypothetical protein n=1 Tax=Streptomyces sp. NBC_01775 TaxID=2975939 RepID=UPI002DDA5E35|nr:hypothetical protein [Streptomyces sp. NBC_01775]WSB74728.1 hypothetical protein OHB04_02320 [Streptomyces sp. NBC_01775]